MYVRPASHDALLRMLSVGSGSASASALRARRPANGCIILKKDKLLEGLACDHSPVRANDEDRAAGFVPMSEAGVTIPRNLVAAMPRRATGGWIRDNPLI